MPTELKHMKEHDMCLQMSFEDTKEGERALVTFVKRGGSLGLRL